MALNLGELTLLMKVDDAQSKGKLADMQKQIDDLTKKVNGLSDAAGKATGFMGKFGEMLKGVAIGAIAHTAMELGHMADNANRAIKVFEGLGGSMERLRANTYGMIDDATLAQKANYAQTMGIKPEEFEKMAQIAKAAAAKTGQSVQYMFDSIVTGVARQSKPILDNLGIIVDAAQAHEKYAASIGKTVSQLTEQELKQGYANEALRQGEQMLKELEQTGVSLVNPYSQMEAQFTNLKLAIGQAIEPLTHFMAVIGAETLTFAVNGVKALTWAFKGLLDPFSHLRKDEFGGTESDPSAWDPERVQKAVYAQTYANQMKRNADTNLNDPLRKFLEESTGLTSAQIEQYKALQNDVKGKEEYERRYAEFYKHLANETNRAKRHAAELKDAAGGAVRSFQTFLEKAVKARELLFFGGPSGEMQSISGRWGKTPKGWVTSPWDKDGHVKFGEGYTMDPSAKGYMAGMFGALGMGGALFGGANQNGAALMAQANQRQEWLIKIAQIMDKWDRSSGGARPGYGTSAEVNSLTGTGMSPAARAKAERDRRNTAEYNANLADMQKGVALGVIQGLSSGDWMGGFSAAMSSALTSKVAGGGTYLESAGMGASIVGGLLQEVLTTFKTNIENVFIKPLKDLMEPLIGVFKGKAMSTMQIFLSAVGAATTHLMAMGPVAAYFLGPFAALGSAAVASGTAILQLSTQTKSYARVQKILELGADRVVQALEPFWQRMVPLAVVFGEMFTVVAHVLEALMPWQGVFKGLYTAANQLELAFLGIELAVQNAVIRAIIPFAEFLYRASHKNKNSDELRDESDFWKAQREETRGLYANARNRKYNEAMGEGLDLVKAIQNINSSVYNGPAGFKVESYRYKAMEAVDGGVDMDAAGLNRPRTFADKEAQKQTQILQDMLVTLRDEKNLTLSVGGEKMTVAMERLLAQREHYRSGGTMTRPSKVITRP